MTVERNTRPLEPTVETDFSDRMSYGGYLQLPTLLSAQLPLTAAEARVVCALAEGETPAEHARRQGLSIHTVRKQIANALAKTGCKRQVELVRLAIAVQG